MASWKHDKRSATERGYGYEWRKLRLVILARDGYRCRCDDCQRTGTLKAATHVDHIVSKADWLRRFQTIEGVDAPSNLRATNRQCHEAKSIREKGGTVRGGADVNGLPLDPGHPWHQPA